jgi:hypothetical protein
MSVEVDPGAGPITRGLGDRHGVAEQAQQTFEQAVARVQPYLTRAPYEDDARFAAIPKTTE